MIVVGLEKQIRLFDDGGGDLTAKFEGMQFAEEDFKKDEDDDDSVNVTGLEEE
jgi:hypothetical protein